MSRIVHSLKTCDHFPYSSHPLHRLAVLSHLPRVAASIRCHLSGRAGRLRSASQCRSVDGIGSRCPIRQLGSGVRHHCRLTIRNYVGGSRTLTRSGPLAGKMLLTIASLGTLWPLFRCFLSVDDGGKTVEFRATTRADLRKRSRPFPDP